MTTHTLNTTPQFKHLNAARYKKLYSDIFKFRTLFGLPIQESNLSHEDQRLHMALFCEEQSELATATDRADHIDAIVDSVYVYMGLLVHIGVEWEQIEGNMLMKVFPLEAMLACADEMSFDFTRAWDIVHSSNISKLCNLDNVLETLTYYKEMGVPAFSEEVFGADLPEPKFRVKVKKHCKDWYGKFYPEGKVLKSVGYEPADLTSL